MQSASHISAWGQERLSVSATGIEKELWGCHDGMDSAMGVEGLRMSRGLNGWMDERLQQAWMGGGICFCRDIVVGRRDGLTVYCG